MCDEIQDAESDEPAEEETVECEDCNGDFPPDEITNGRCEDCNEHYSSCNECGDETHHDNLNEVSGDDQVCDHCLRQQYTRCSDCGTYERDENTVGYHNGSVCESCYQDSYFTCDHCDEVCHSDNYAENGCCNDCHEEESGPIQEYSADPPDDFFGEPKDRIYYGIELEVVSRRNRAESAQETLDAMGDDFIVCKEDGSLPDGGYEIVTAPADLPSHRERWSKLLDSPPAGLVSWDNSSCGMHVHVSREPLSQLTIGKILVFVNSEENRGFIVRIAGRSSESYAKMIPKKASDATKSAANRYQAINLKNDATVEFRIFRGTLRPESFFKNLEFVAACVAFCRHAGLAELTSLDFCKFVDSRRKDYPSLVAWLRSHGYLKSPKPKKENQSPCV